MAPSHRTQRRRGAACRAIRFGHRFPIDGAHTHFRPRILAPCHRFPYSTSAKLYMGGTDEAGLGLGCAGVPPMPPSSPAHPCRDSFPPRHSKNSRLSRIALTRAPSSPRPPPRSYPIRIVLNTTAPSGVGSVCFLPRRFVLDCPTARPETLPASSFGRSGRLHTPYWDAPGAPVLLRNVLFRMR